MDIDKLTLARTSPAGFAWYCSGQTWSPAPHLQLLSRKLVDVAMGRIKRLMVFMPPRHGKSELISRYTPAWYLGRWPDKKVMLCSYSDDFAASWGRQSRDVFTEHAPGMFGVSPNPETAGGKQWEVMGRRGVMVTAGVGGGITGKGADLLIIDDPVKNAQDAASEVIQQAHNDWWRSTVRTRLQVGAGVVIVMTRWHEADLAGQLLGMAFDEGADQWEVLSLPAYAQEETTVSYTDARRLRLGPDALGRAPGDPLWPRLHDGTPYFDVGELEATRRALGSYFWQALYMQQPAALEGQFFGRAHVRFFEKLEPEPDGRQLLRLHRDSGHELVDTHFCTKFCTVDTAESEKKTADYSVFATWLMTPTKDLVLWDRERVQFSPTNLKPVARRVFYEQRPSFMAIEKRSSGAALISELVAEGFPIVPSVPDADKVTRALPAAARMEEHRVFFPLNTPWVEQEWIPELMNFPNGSHDDQVDTLSLAALQLPTTRLARRVHASGRSRLRTGGQTIAGGVMSRRF